MDRSRRLLAAFADAADAIVDAAQATGGGVEKEIRLIFVRHGESVWNYVFNRGFAPSFLVRLVAVTLRELYLLPWDDSAYIDSPLSALGREQCEELRRFLQRPCLDPNAQRDFDVLTKGESESLLVSSQLRRAAATAFIALSDRLARSKEKVVLHSSCQEISRNFDTMRRVRAMRTTPDRDLTADNDAATEEASSPPTARASQTECCDRASSPPSP